MKFLNNVLTGTYNKALVPLGVLFVYYMNDTFGYTLPTDDLSVQTMIMLMTMFLTWLIPNMEKKE